MILVNIGFVKQNINQVVLILFTKLENCTFAQKVLKKLKSLKKSTQKSKVQ